jgi:ribonuclease HII
MRCFTMDKILTNHMIETDNHEFNDALLYIGQDYYCAYGYGTAEHIAALQKHDPCPVHRSSFAPLKTWGGG